MWSKINMKLPPQAPIPISVAPHKIPQKKKSQAHCILFLNAYRKLNDYRIFTANVGWRKRVWFA